MKEKTFDMSELEHGVVSAGVVASLIHHTKLAQIIVIAKGRLRQKILLFDNGMLGFFHIFSTVVLLIVFTVFNILLVECIV